jgi:hypothetical protein
MRLARRPGAWKDAEILLLPHQLDVLQRQQVRRPRLRWSDRALIAALAGAIPKAQRAGCGCWSPRTPAVAACVRVLCGRLADRPSDSDIATMMDRYLVLEAAPEHVVFQIRLGLCVIDVAGQRR